VITTKHTRQCVLELEALPHRIAQVRRIVSAQLRYWRLDPLIDTTLLGITELLANVHRHAQPDKRCAVELCHEDGRLTVSVADSDPRPPRAGLRSDAMDTCGRGLAMLAALTDDWGTRPGDESAGKVVWFRLSEPPPAPKPVAVPTRAAVALPLRAPLAIGPRPEPVAV
jgi:anti-sigma regulatory factor (Ser/Thr protein kinase)